MVLGLAPLLLLFLFSAPSPAARAADHGDGYITVATGSLKPKTACFGHRVTPPANLTWIPVDLQNGPCSSSSSHAAAPSLADQLHRDQLRAADVQRRLSMNGTDDNKAPAAAGGPETTMQTDAKIPTQVGTRSAGTNGGSMGIHPAATTGRGPGRGLVPGVKQTVVLDTASDVPWVQCVPCPVPPCHPQTDAVYDPTMSATYAPFPCNSPICRRLGPYANGCAANNQCQYRVTYPDGSTTSGTYISDVLTLTPTTSITNFQFGCSHVDRGSFDPQAAGIMALGGGPESLASQTAANYGSAFAYCIPPSSSYLGFFILGAPRDVASRRYVLTPMLRDRRVPTFYSVRLRAITVGGQRLGVPDAVFAAGTVMDSRTAITRLPPTAYQALRAAFRSSMSMYRAAAPKGSLDTCYDFTGVRSVRLPRVALVFDGPNAVVELDPSGILFNGCLAFTPNRDDRMPGILGNVQQRTIEVLYNVGGSAVGFRRGAC